MSHTVHPCPRTSGFSLCQGKEHLVPPLWICHSNETFDSKLFVIIYANKMGLWGYPKNDEGILLVIKNLGEFMSRPQIPSYLPMLQSLLGPTSLTAFSDGEALHMVKVITRFWGRRFQACSLKSTILASPQIISNQENVGSMTISNTTNFCSNSILDTLGKTVIHRAPSLRHKINTDYFTTALNKSSTSRNMPSSQRSRT
jgi:hypothetical protein